MILSAVSKAVECWYYISIFSSGVFFFCPGLHQSLSKELGAVISLWHFCFDREDKNEWTVLLSSSNWPHSSLYPGAHQSKPVWHGVSVSGVKKGSEKVPWQGYHQFPRPPGQAPGVCTAQLESFCKNSNTWVTRVLPNTTQNRQLCSWWIHMNQCKNQWLCGTLRCWHLLLFHIMA